MNDSPQTRTYGKVPFLYALTVLIITWAIASILFIDPEKGMRYFAVVMAVPALTALYFNKKYGTGMACFSQRMNAKALAFGILFPLLFIVLSAVIAGMSGMAQSHAAQWFSVNHVVAMIVTIFVNLFTVLGEEYGWRGYLLPKLTADYGKVKAVLMVGIIWALYHAPVVYLLAKATGMEHPLLVTAVQSAGVFVLNIPFAYCFYLSGNLIPVLFFHSVWNVVNTTVLGDIYKNTQGIMHGDLLTINGEGLLGLVLGLVVLLLYCMFRIKAVIRRPLAGKQQ
ncbi:CPBP family intramembrane glutamic endopeptidase [Paenibacillus sp. CAA11]|uniref:CPBP family intramembrane glutamic endopeptidase n=1 Tax=Paenibacillus sp. CAA11 TaxID=1532905 RepID=UPI00131F203B|nr:type II CAAX endopeptidase family protein [Paenibacillus sp. CAA11]